MNVLLYLINSTQLLLLFLNGRTGSQPHDDDDDDDVLLAQVLLYRYDKARRGGQLIRKGHHSPLTHQPLCCASLVGPSIPTYLGGSTLPFYLQLSDLSRHVLFSFAAACHLHHYPHLHRRHRVCHQPAKRERERERKAKLSQQRRLAGNIFASSVFVSRDQSRTTFYQD